MFKVFNATAFGKCESLNGKKILRTKIEKQRVTDMSGSIRVIWENVVLLGRRANGHDGCMGRFILALSAGVPDNVGHLVTTQEGREDAAIFLIYFLRGLLLTEPECQISIC